MKISGKEGYRMKQRMISVLLTLAVVFSLMVPAAQAAITAPKTTTIEAQKIWNYFYAKLGNEYGVAGVMGNLKAESSLKAINLQNSYEKKLGYTDTTYTDAVDDGSYTEFASDSAGYGIAQWTYSSRKKNLLKFAQDRNASIGNLEMQLDFLWKELSSGYSGLITTLKTADSIQTASDAFLVRFERPADQSDAVKEKRAGYGQTYYDKYATGKGTSTTPSTPAATTLKLGTITGTVGSLSVNDQPKASKYCTSLFTIPEGAVCTVYTNKTSGHWYWVEYNGQQGWASGNYIKLGSAIKSMQYLDINGYIDGSNTGNIKGYGRADVYINGFKVANDCTDYYVKWPQGTKYELRDIQASDGYTYTGMKEGSRTGTIGSSTANVRLILNAVPKTVRINFYLNYDYSAMTTKTVTQGQAYGTLPNAYPKDGYTFEGWYTAKTGGTKITASTIFNGSSDITLYPRYTQNPVAEPQEVTIYYYTDGNLTMTQTTAIGDIYASDYMVKDGYTFLGWYSSPTGGTKYNGTKITETSPRTLYAQYAAEAPKEYTVCFYVNGAAWKTMTVTNGGTYGTLPNPSLSGYEFQGWYTSASGGTRITSSTKVNLTETQNLFARFTQVDNGGNIILQINNPTMYINGRPSSIDAQGTVPVIRNDRTLLPVRAVFEAMGGTVGWDGQNRIVTLSLDGETLYLQIGTGYALDGNLNKYYLDAAPVIINDRTMLPIRFIVEYFDGTVEWDGSTRTVLIKY